MSQEEFNRRVAEYTGDAVDVIGLYVNKHQKVAVRCKKCGNEWDLSPASLMPSNMIEHSFKGCPKCLYEETHFECECALCHKKIVRLRSEIEGNKTGLFFCSQTCGNRYKNLQIKRNDSAAYRRNAFEAYPHKCAICGWDADERILEVHHIDENRENNKLENLAILCPICHKKLTLHLYSFEELIRSNK